jgi:WD40 repeat protein
VESRRLAAESISVLTKYPQRSVLLAVETAKVEQPLHGVRVGADEKSLREALGFIGGRLVARADGPIMTVAISPDNRWVVTGSDDKTARLWDLSAKDPGANPVVLRGHRGLIRERTSAGREAARKRGVRFGRPRKLTPKQENLARRLVSEGKAVRELALAFKVHAATIYRLAYSATGMPN